jgi:hypothetical protein
MLKKHMAACLVATAFMTLPALAQTSTAPSATAPSATAPSASQPPTTAPRSAAAGQFLNQQEPDQWRGSRLVGLNVYGSDNEKIGDINDVLVDRQGNADAVVIGVGGFLGIGEKNVALPFKSLEFVMEDTRRTASRTDAPARTDAPRTDATGSTTAAPATTDRPAATATTGTTAGTGTAAPTAGTTAATDRTSTGTSRAADRGYPDHAVVRMSRADLQNAPTFRYLGERSSDDRSSAPRGAGTSAPGTPSTAPRQ